jgi:hypothetical protein
MTATINDKFKESEHGMWLPINETPSDILLEQATLEGKPSGIPAIKSGGVIFRLSEELETTDPNLHVYRVLAVGTIVVLIQE